MDKDELRHYEYTMEEKAGIEQAGLDPIQPMPQILQGMTKKELEKLYKRATLKMDLVIMPMLMLMFILNYLDRMNIAAAKLAGIMEDLEMSSVQYQSCISILYAGYILMMVPSNMVIGKIKFPGAYVCTAMALWGIISAAQTVVHTFSTLAVCRFFIGMVEATFFPGALFYLSIFYTRRQYAFRAALYYSGAQLGNAFGPLLAIAILKLDGVHGLAGWRWLFLVEGVATLGCAGLFAFFMPNQLEKVPGLTEKELVWIKYNQEADSGQEDHRDEITALQGLAMACRDPKTWLLMANLYCIFTAAAVVNFFPTVVASLGYSRNISYLLTAPPFLLCCIAMLGNGFHSDKKKERYLHIVIPLCMTTVANIIAVSTLNIAALYTAMMLLPGSFYAASTVLYSWITGTINQPVAKRATAVAMIVSVCNTPNVWTSYLYDGAPRFLNAFSVNLVASVLAIVIATAVRWYLNKENQMMDTGGVIKRSPPTNAQMANGFRYLL
ncbi:hypothetical protein CLAIMM_14931 [Cladophialophora immunda]|nr:hypothetical protein CLAIMM_14931 [Cladophialophora immunda]